MMKRNVDVTRLSWLNAQSIRLKLRRQAIGPYIKPTYKVPSYVHNLIEKTDLINNLNVCNAFTQCVKDNDNKVY